MVKEKTPSAIYSFTLLANKLQVKELLKLNDLGRIYYNAVLGEALRRMRKMKTDPLYKETVIIPKNTGEGKKQRKTNFKLLNSQYGFTDYSLQKFGIECKNSSKFLNQVGTHVLQKLATRAFRSVQKLSFGKAKKVNFVRKGELISLEGKDNGTFLRYSNGFALIGDMCIKCKLRKNDKYLDYFLKHKIKYCRLVVKEFNGNPKFFLQVIYEGYPYKKVERGYSDTGIDIGPSTIATVNDKEAHLEKFCAELPNLDKKIKKLQRKASRKLRLLNPQNYDDKGAVIKGSKKWKKSNNYLKLKNEVSNIQRILTERRKQLHGMAINNIIRMSKKVCGEKLSYKAFQRMYGKSVARCSPGSFVKRLKDKITLLGGEFQEINTYKTKLSQTCTCGRIHKKGLSERMHICECGVTQQRDLFSAYLTLFVDKNNILDLSEAKTNYHKYEPLMNSCIEKLRILKQTEPRKISVNFGI